MRSNQTKWLLGLFILLVAPSVTAQFGPWSEEIPAAFPNRTMHRAEVFDPDGNGPRLWVFGGIVGTGTRSDVWSSADGVKWVMETAKAPWPARRTFASAVHDPDGNGERLWVLGGWAGAGSNHNDVWSSKDGVNWTNHGNAQWPARTNHVAVAFDPGDGNGKRLWVLGGYAGSNRNDVWSSKDGITWTNHGNAPWPARINHTAVVHDPDGNGERLWVMGGTGGGNLSDVWSSANGVNWTLHPVSGPRWTGRRQHAAAVFDPGNGNGKHLAIIGGHNGSTKVNDVWISKGGAAWVQVAASTEWSGRDGLVAVGADLDGTGDKLWVLGGNSGNNAGAYGNDAWFSANGQNWQQASPSAAWNVRQNHTTEVFDPDGSGKRLWVMGGEGNSGFARDVWSSEDGLDWGLETDQAQWPARGDHASAIFDPDGNGERLWIMGGLGANSAYLNDVWSSTDGVNWGESVSPGLAPMWSGRHGLAAAVFDPNGNGKRLWVMGGFGITGGGHLNDIWSTTDGVNWVQETQAAPWSARMHHTVTVFDPDGNGKRLWVIGGMALQGPRNDVWSSVDGVNWVQEVVSAEWPARAGHALAVFGGALWLTGGTDETSTHLSDVWYSLNGKDWIQTTDAAEWMERYGHTAAAFAPSGSDERLWIMGGYTEWYMNDVWWFDGLAPAFTNPPPEIAIAGKPYQHNLGLVGSPTPEITVENFPGWLTLTGAVLSGIPTADDIGDSGVIKITASNSIDSVTLDFSITVQGLAPTFLGTPPATAPVGLLYEYEVPLEGAPEPVVTASGLPGWLSFDDVGLILSGTPPAGASGLSYAIELKAENGWGDPAVQAFTLSVPSVFGGGLGGGGAGGCATLSGPTDTTWSWLAILAAALAIALGGLLKGMRKPARG